MNDQDRIQLLATNKARLQTNVDTTYSSAATELYEEPELRSEEGYLVATPDLMAVHMRDLHLSSMALIDVTIRLLRPVRAGFMVALFAGVGVMLWTAIVVFVTVAVAWLAWR